MACSGEVMLDIGTALIEVGSDHEKLQGDCCCGFSLLSAVIGVLYFLRKRFPTSLTEQQQNTVLGPFSFMITLYAFLLGFTVVNLWQTFDQADRTTAKEAETAGVLYLLTDSFPDSQSARQTLIHYVESVAQDEWPAMAGGNISPKTEALYIEVCKEVRGLVPTSAREQAIYAELLNQLGNLVDYRRDRILLIDGSLPSIMWWSLLFGGLLLVRRHVTTSALVLEIKS